MIDCTATLVMLYMGIAMFALGFITGILQRTRYEVKLDPDLYNLLLSRAEKQEQQEDEYGS